MRPGTPVHTITGRYMYSTEKAVQFRVDMISGIPIPVPKVEWFPFSQITKTFRDPNSHGGDWLIVSEWILEQKNIPIPQPTATTGAEIAQSQKSDTHLSKGHFDEYEDDIPF